MKASQSPTRQIAPAKDAPVLDRPARPDLGPMVRLPKLQPDRLVAHTCKLRLVTKHRWRKPAKQSTHKRREELLGPIVYLSCIPGCANTRGQHIHIYAIKDIHIYMCMPGCANTRGQQVLKPQVLKRTTQQFPNPLKLMLSKNSGRLTLQ